MTVAVERLAGAPSLLSGLPYAADDGDRVRRTAEGEVTSAGGPRLTHPAGRGPDHFDSGAELTQEQAAFALAADPRGYGDPDEGWGHLVSSTALEADPAPGAPEGPHLFAVRFGPGGAFTPAFAHDRQGLTLRTEAFVAVVGEPGGEARPRLHGRGRRAPRQEVPRGAVRGSVAAGRARAAEPGAVTAPRA
uniref:hypothetical protein n=1 Tax=Streptomyces filipinensis TaxID=66887 RepID=UPI003571057F